MKHVNVSIRGRVHGVWFRKTAKLEADNRSICGFVRNMDDGSVYLEAEGETEQIDGFLEWCKHGPENAQVSHTEITEGALKHFNDFKIIY